MENDMAELITAEIFNHLVQLAALEMRVEETEYLRSELNHQLTSIHELEAIPLDVDTAVSSHGITYAPDIMSKPRPDDWVPYINSDDIITQAPESEDNYIVVPDIPHEELE
jgi:aspartyl/glutamyl-tRNA(Asn/Gln) amidotransferase C subunit